MSYVDLISILQGTIRMSVPLILTALAGLYAERSGVVDIGLEGKLLAAAFCGASAAAVTGSAALGLLSAIGIGVVFSGIHGYASISQRGDQIVSGTAINFIAMGATVIIANAWFGQAGRTPSLPSDAKLNTVTLPFAAEIREIPVLGTIYSDILSGHFLLTYAAYALIPITW